MFIANLLKHWTYQLFAPGTLLREKYEAFRKLLDYDTKSHELIAELEQIYYDELKVDVAVVEKKYQELSSYVSTAVESLSKICPTCFLDLKDYFKKIDFYARLALSPHHFDFSPPFSLPLAEIDPDGLATVGGKALNLALVRNQLNLPVPNGFVVTANAYHYFIESNDLRPRIDAALSQLDINSADSLERTSLQLQELILKADVPEDIREAITIEFDRMTGGSRGRLRLSVRSSAVGEDSQASFAGQYRTVLNVTGDRLVSVYRQVLASKYSPSAIYYRINYGLSDLETPMAVLVLEMINPRASGVIYTRDPGDATADIMFIHAVWGLGEMLVNGSVSPSIIVISRDTPHRIIRREVAAQPVKALCGAEGGTEMVGVEQHLQSSLPLDTQSILDLARWAMKVEEFHGSPQDIEWCIDQQGELYLLQSRPLELEIVRERMMDCGSIEVSHEVLLRGGTKASSGVGAGKVFWAETAAELDDVPEGAILVTRTPSPDYVRAMGKLNAVVTDVGSTAGHFASVAREFGVPTLVNTGVATKKLTPGREVTVYADGKVVYEGIVSQLLESPCAARSLIAGSPFMERIRKILDYLSPLNLLDPKAESFAPAGCKTLHDILRFCHEKGVQEMFSLGLRGGGRARGAKRLSADIPIAVNVLDLGGGLSKEAGAKKEVGVDEIISLPFQAIWKGLSHPDIYWDPHLKHFDWQEFDRISAGIVPLDRLGSYAIVSHDYLNLHIHFGYHFVVVDSLCGDEHSNNYAALRFAGGGANFFSRSLRANFLVDVLAHHGFTVETRGDLVDAQLTRKERRTLEEKLETIGILLGCTRLLDMALEDSSDVERLVRKFLSGNYDISPIARR
jgi:pyruvate,water dikinase